MTRVIRQVIIASVALVIACGVWIASPTGASRVSPAQQVEKDFNAVAKAGDLFERQLEAEAANYGNTSVETFASTLAEQTYHFATPLENEQEALLDVVLDDNFSSKTRLASAVLAATITKFVYVLGLSGFAAGGETGLEGWAKTFQSTKTLYQSQAKTVLTDLGYSVAS
jgi:hypothetical protein